MDNNPARVAASRYFREKSIPVIFTAVSADGDFGYVFVQDRTGPCIGCLFPDMADDDRYPCPGTPAIADVLQLIGALVVYAVDSLLMNRPRTWNYRRISLSDNASDGASLIDVRSSCRMFIGQERLEAGLDGHDFLRQKQAPVISITDIPSNPKRQ